MRTPSKLFRPLGFIASAALLLGSGGAILVISTNHVSNDSNTSYARWEPTSAAGNTWVHAWLEIGGSSISYASSWNGSSWNSPQPLDPPYHLGSLDVNMNWDSARNRFVFVALDSFGSPHNGWYGYSTDSTGTAWVFGNGGQPIFSSATADWDYPSIGVDSSGRIIVGAVSFQSCPFPLPEGPTGYYAAVSTDGSTFASPSPVVTFASGCTAGYSGFSGAQSRVAATNNLFETFIPSLNAANLPTYIGRWESSDGLAWHGDLGIGMGSFGAPNNNSPGAPVIFYAPLLAAQGYTNGLWSVAFQANNGGYNNAVVCIANRGCGWVNAAADDEFLVGTSVSGDGGSWVSYYAYQSSRNLPLITQAIYIPAGLQPIGATTYPANPGSTRHLGCQLRVALLTATPPATFKRLPRIYTWELQPPSSKGARVGRAIPAQASAA